MAAGARFSRDGFTVRLAVTVLRRHLAGVDEVFELLLVLVSVAIRRVAQDAALLGEVFEGGTRVARGAEA
jgi:hypothetical protein